MRLPTPARILEPFQRFIQLESASGLLLFLAAIVALLLANSPLQEAYQGFKFLCEHPVNDGLMAVFFLIMGLEIKREMLAGELGSIRKSALPMIAALGGMLVPAGLYAILNHDSPAASGWGIPMATDIAFALGALILLGKRIPSGLKVFLVALAIIDDIGAILVIALFYTRQIHFGALALGGACLVALFALNRFGVRNLAAYLFVGFFLWLFLLRSGIHATLAGVALAFFIPHPSKDEMKSASLRLEEWLHPWVSFGILPLFALVNAGVTLIPETRGLLLKPPGLGILAGLCLGKPLGITLFSGLAVRTGAGELPHGMRWSHMLGAGLLGGIGFTMSLFIAGLGLHGAPLLDGAKLSVLCASLFSGLAGFGYLWWVGKRKA